MALPAVVGPRKPLTSFAASHRVAPCPGRANIDTATQCIRAATLLDDVKLASCPALVTVATMSGCTLSSSRRSSSSSDGRSIAKLTRTVTVAATRPSRTS